MSTDDTSTYLFRALGAQGALPRRFALRYADEEALDWLGGGEIDARADELFEDGEPTPSGLFDEAIFGDLRRDAAGKIRFEAWRSEQARNRPQANRFAMLRLPVPLVHPLVVRQARGDTRRTLDALLGGTAVVVGHDVVSPGDDPKAIFAGEAVEALIAAGVLDLPRTTIVRRVPVLPAGLRPVIAEGDRLLVHDHTLLTQRLVARGRRDARLRELGAPPLIMMNEAITLQRYLDALFVSGAVLETDEDGTFWVPAPRGAEPGAPSLTQYLRSSPAWATGIDALAHAEERVFSKRWHSPHFFFRAWIEALALEIVPLDADGRVDEIALEHARVDRAARLFDDVYHQLLGNLYKNIVHDRTDTVPHVDVYAGPPRADGTRLVVTAGLSARAREPFVELALRVPATLADAALEDWMQTLLLIAKQPTSFATGQRVQLGKAIFPGCPHAAFVFTEATDDVLERVGAVLPRRPRFVLAEPV